MGARRHRRASGKARACRRLGAGAMSEWTFAGRLWEYPGQAGNWFFVTVPRAESRQILEAWQGPRKPGGSRPVVARIGAARWRTSLFWDRRRQCYLLPVKAAVRRQEGLAAGPRVEVELRLAPENNGLAL